MAKKKNYSKMYSEEEQNVAVEGVPVIEDTEAPVETPVENVEPEFITGVVVGCTRLNVRENPDCTAKVLCEIPVSSEVKIDASNEDDEWFKVCTITGIEGFCMKKFITVRQ